MAGPSARCAARKCSRQSLRDGPGRRWVELRSFEIRSELRLLIAGPRPLIDLGFIDPVFVSVSLTIDLHVTQLLLNVSARHAQRGNPVNNIHRHAETINLIPNSQV